MRFVVNTHISTFLGIYLTILIWNPSITEAKSISTSPVVYKRLEGVFKERNHIDSTVAIWDNMTPSSPLQTRNMGKLKSYHPKLKQRKLTNDGLSNPFQEYLTNLIKFERRKGKKGGLVQSHSREKRGIKTIIKKIVLKILIFFKILVKHFVFVSKKAAIAAG